MYCVVLIIRLASHSGPLTPNWILLTYVNCVPFDHLRRPTQIFLLQLKKCFYFYLCVCVSRHDPTGPDDGRPTAGIDSPAGAQRGGSWSLPRCGHEPFKRGGANADRKCHGQSPNGGAGATEHLVVDGGQAGQFEVHYLLSTPLHID